MLFNSFGYLCFMFVAVPLHWLLPQKYRTWMIAIFSVLFYAMWRWEFCFLMLFSSVVDYVSAKNIDQSDDKGVRRGWLLFSLITNIGLLVFFKYTYFILDNMRILAGGSTLDLGFKIILPLGISFYTFQTISYTIDVYRRASKPSKDFASFFAYVTFWPQLIAGPILRANEVIPQLNEDRKFSTDKCFSGIERIIQGLFKKVVIADNLSYFVDQAFSLDPYLFNALDVWVAAFLFGFQIYFDFAGYSDIAIGSAMLLGINFPENFNWPYLARNPKEFWQRWHISLSSWIRDYLYLPLTGGKFQTKSTGGIAVAVDYRRDSALFITWIIMGLWHGAGWLFAAWGIYHASLIFLYRKATFLKTLDQKYPNVAWGVMLLLVMAGWIPFRSQSFAQMGVMFQTILNPLKYTFQYRVVDEYGYISAALILVAMLVIHKFRNQDARFDFLRSAFKPIQIATMVFLIMVYLKPVNQFIYFQF